MDQQDKEQLRAHLMRGVGKEKSYEEKKRLKEHAKQRKAQERRTKRRRNGWKGGDDVAFAPFEKRERLSRAAPPPSAEVELDSSAELALVVALAPGRARVRLDDEELDIALAPQLRATQQSEIAVGDVAFVERRALVRAVAPRRTRLARPDPANPHRERVLAANVDVAVIVTSVVAPPFKPGLVERVLLALERGGVHPFVVVNKIDLADAPARRAIDESLGTWRELGVPFALVSASTGTGIAELRAALDGRRCVFVGHSGVGKSSLLNALAPELARTIGAVRASDGKGRHTTTRSELFELWPGTEAIDTPGVRQFGLWRIDRAALRNHFVDLAAFARHCRFTDCSHLVEPDCAVRRAIDEGRVPRARFERYARLAVDAKD